MNISLRRLFASLLLFGVLVPMRTAYGQPSEFATVIGSGRSEYWAGHYVETEAPLLSAAKRSADSTEKLREIVSLLRALWRQDFDSNYQKYMLGTSPTVILIPRDQMIEIAAARLDGRRRDGETTQGLIIGDEPNVKIVVVYDDIAPLFVAKSICHEIGHLELRDRRLSRNTEEAHVRKVVDTGFFEKVFGRRWLETTVTLLKKKVITVEKDRMLYRGYTPEAIETFYQQLRKAGIEVEKTSLHDGIVASMVFILTNSEKSLSAALDADDDAIER